MKTATACITETMTWSFVFPPVTQLALHVSHFTAMKIIAITTIVTVNGGTSVTNFAPEPASLILIAIALLCVRLTARRAAD